MAVVAPEYVVQKETKIKLVEKMMSLSGDSYKITDDEANKMFELDDAALSIKDKKNLRDAQGNVACSLQRKLLALKPVWNIVRNDVTIATVKKKLVSIRPTIVVHLQGEDGDRSADFSAKGNFRAKKFEVTDMRGGGEKEYAQIKKEGKFSGGGAFLRAAMTDSDVYFIDAQPGADAAFLIAVCIAIDEIIHEEPEGDD